MTCLGKALRHYFTHRIRQIMRYLHHPLALLYRHLIENGDDSVCIDSLYNGNDGTALAVCRLVGKDGVQLAIAESRLVYTQMRADVFRKQQPFFCMLFLLPRVVIAQMFLVLAFK